LIPFSSLGLDGWGSIAEAVTAFIACVGFVLAIVSAGFVRQQIIDARRETEIGLVTGMTEQMLEIDRALIEYPTQRKYFDRGIEPPDDGSEESERATTIAFALANALDHVVNHLFLMDEASERAWNDYIWNLHEVSPVFRRVLDTHRAWWPYLQKRVVTSTPRRDRATSAFR